MKSWAVFLFACVVALDGLSSLGCANRGATAGDYAPMQPAPTATPEVDDGGAPADASNEMRTGPPPIVGSPLCNASRWMGCYPDNNFHSSNSNDCPNGSTGSGFDNGQTACRVQPNGSEAGVGPVCGPAGPSTEGMPCNGSPDCANGYECTADGRCHAYCCAGECSSQNSFCDILPMLTYPTLKVPVCTPITPCGLLGSEGGTCPASQTCAVVRDNGATGCVAIGPRQVGDECNTDHCARGLVCLGTSGERMCYQLCHTMMHSNECISTPQQVCKGGLPLFPVPGIGICQ